MAKKILAVGLDLESDMIETADFASKTSLLDWDIVVFRPDISQFLTYQHDNSEYQGKTCLNDRQSFRLKDACEHWRREIKEAVEAGKTVIAFLNSPTELFIATGEKQTSGTGRNQKVTRIVSLYSSYFALPISMSWTATTGSAMTLDPRCAGILGRYWLKFEQYSMYQVVWQNDVKELCISTKHGHKPVSMLIRSKKTSGTLLLLPELNLEHDKFSEERDDELYYTDEYRRFCHELISELIALEKLLSSTSERTLEPEWALREEFALNVESELRDDLLLAESQLERAQKGKEAAASALEDAGQLRALLFEKGKPLEAAILEALHTLGFSAEKYHDNHSQFDVIFYSSEGRLLGEAEGKDNKPINIDKLRQLSMNIHEDLARDEVDTPAKGILFGNGFRLKQPSDRGQQFTDKCISAATSSGICLLSTDRLFAAAKYIKDNNDKDYAKQCRQALLQAVGIVELPTPPEALEVSKLDEVGVNEDIAVRESIGDGRG